MDYGGHRRDISYSPELLCATVVVASHAKWKASCRNLMTFSCTHCGNNSQFPTLALTLFSLMMLLKLFVEYPDSMSRSYKRTVGKASDWLELY